jgi:uncharacterized protein YndB with AHSA1/START domain
MNSRTIKATPEQIWAVLADGWLYPGWVVGATRMRAVEPAWPEQGAKLHHSAGVWPAVLSDNTEVLTVDPGRSIRLRARGWPVGEAEVAITLTAVDGETLVEMEEDAVSGPALLVPKPLRSILVRVRNVETLRRLAFIAEGREAGG